MPVIPYKGLDVYYEIYGQEGDPLVVFVNGLTQRTAHWTNYAEALVPEGLRVLTFDLLGQGLSAKPILNCKFEDNVDLIVALLDHLKVEKAYIGGVSYGGVLVLEMPIRFPERVKGIFPMSCFAQMDATVWRIGCNLYEGLTKVSFDYLVNLLAPLNFSPTQLATFGDNFTLIRRTSAAINDLYAIENLMESLMNFPGLVDDLDKIDCPALIMNAEFDAFTPRHLHETMRLHIKTSRLMLIQHAYHAFTLEVPQIAQRLITDFVRKVEAGEWVGDRSVWIAEDKVDAPRIAFPCPWDHRRAIPFPYPPGEENSAKGEWLPTPRPPRRDEAVSLSPPKVKVKAKVKVGAGARPKAAVLAKAKAAPDAPKAKPAVKPPDQPIPVRRTKAAGGKN